MSPPTKPNGTWYEILQDTNNHVLELVKNMGDVQGRIRVLTERIEHLRANHEALERANRTVIAQMSLKMEPTKCAYMHAELEKRIAEKIMDPGDPEKCANEIEKRIMNTIKSGAKGWIRTATTILKIIAYASVAFGGSAAGIHFAKALGG